MIAAAGGRRSDPGGALQAPGSAGSTAPDGDSNRIDGRTPRAGPGYDNSAPESDQLDLDQHPRVDQTGDLDHRRHRAHAPEDLAVGAPDLVRAGDIGDVHPSLNDVLGAEAGPAELMLELAQDLSGLLVGSFADDEACGSTEVVPPMSTQGPATTTRQKPIGSSKGDGGRRRAARSGAAESVGDRRTPGTRRRTVISGGSGGGW